jgi:patatin-like phospholipase/acyl hydrolase
LKTQKISEIPKPIILILAYDFSNQYITDALEAAKAYIEKGCTYYTRDDFGPLVKDAIADFIQANKKPEQSPEFPSS